MSKSRTFALAAAPPNGPNIPGGWKAGLAAEKEAALRRPWISQPNTYASIIFCPELLLTSASAKADGRQEDVPWVGGNPWIS